MGRAKPPPPPGEARRNRRYDALCILLVLAFIALLYSQSMVRSGIVGSRGAEETSPSWMRKRNASCAAAGEGEWVREPGRVALYDEKCRFHRKAWNCGRNRREGLLEINEWVWRPPSSCRLPPLQPHTFLAAFRGMSLGFVGDSLNENMLVSLLCILSTADPAARPWKRRRAWRGAYFPTYNVTVAYHRAVLLADYHQWKAADPTGPLEKLGYEEGYQVNIDLPAVDWINITKFYDILVFNTGHCFAGGGSINFQQINLFCFSRMGNPSSPH